MPEQPEEPLTELDIDAIVAGYVDRMPAAREALMRDPLFHAHITWLRVIGPILDRVLAHEGLDACARERVVNTLVYGDPDPEKVIADLAAYDQRVNQAIALVIADLNKPPDFTGLGDLLPRPE